MSIRLTWHPLVVGDSQKVYRSTATFDINTLPPVLATLGAEEQEYIDETAAAETDYYYAVSVVLGARERLCPVLFVPAPPIEVSQIAVFAFFEEALAGDPIEVSQVSTFAFFEPSESKVSQVSTFTFFEPV